MEDVRVHGAGVTSVFTAKMRALETAREDGLISDPFAQRFVDASGLDYGSVTLSALTGQRLFESNVIRTWWLDAEVEAALNCGCTQVVVLGAGLDSRAFRLHEREGARFFEVEGPDLSSFKRDVLESDGRIEDSDWVQIEVGFETDQSWPQALEAAGHRVEEATCWIAEGMFYLPESVTSEVLQTTRERSGPGSRWAMTHFGLGSLYEAQTREMSQAAHERSGRGFASVVADPLEWVTSAGWQLRSARTIAEVGEELDRTVVYAAPEVSGREYTWLISAGC